MAEDIVDGDAAVETSTIRCRKNCFVFHLSSLDCYSMCIFHFSRFFQTEDALAELQANIHPTASDKQFSVLKSRFQGQKADELWKSANVVFIWFFSFHRKTLLCSNHWREDVLLFYDVQNVKIYFFTVFVRNQFLRTLLIINFCKSLQMKFAALSIVILNYLGEKRLFWFLHFP